MARTIITVPYHCRYEDAVNIIGNLLTSKGYKLTNIATGETVWKQGTGLMTGMKFVKVEFTQSEIILSAWVSVGICSATMGEMDLNGFVGVIPKKQVQKVLDEIIAQFRVY